MLRSQHQLKPIDCGRPTTDTHDRGVCSHDMVLTSLDAPTLRCLSVDRNFSTVTRHRLTGKKLNPAILSMLEATIPPHPFCLSVDRNFSTVTRHRLTGNKLNPAILSMLEATIPPHPFPQATGWLSHLSTLCPITNSPNRFSMLWRE
jgi:hypothetical protein